MFLTCQVSCGVLNIDPCLLFDLFQSFFLSASHVVEYTKLTFFANFTPFGLLREVH